MCNPSINILAGSLCQNQLGEDARTAVLRLHRRSLNDDVIGIGATYAGYLGEGSTAGNEG
jgi:hypothetical protein